MQRITKLNQIKLLAKYVIAIVAELLLTLLRYREILSGKFIKTLTSSRQNFAANCVCEDLMKHYFKVNVEQSDKFVEEFVLSRLNFHAISSLKPKSAKNLSTQTFF